MPTKATAPTEQPAVKDLYQSRARFAFAGFILSLIRTALAGKWHSSELLALMAGRALILAFLIVLIRPRGRRFGL